MYALLTILCFFGLFPAICRAWKAEQLLGECPEIPLPVWDLNDPSIVNVGGRNGVAMTYQLPNSVVQDFTYEVFEIDCIGPIESAASNQENSSAAPIFVEQTWNQEDDVVRLDLEINPSQIRNFPAIYAESGQGTTESRGDVRLCIRVGLWNTAGVMVTFLDSPVSFGVQFSTTGRRKMRGQQNLKQTEENDRMLHGRHSAAYNAEANNGNKEPATDVGSRSMELPRILQGSPCEDNWGVQIFTCPNVKMADFSRFDYDTLDASDEAIQQGSFLHLCIQLSEDAVRDGAVLNQISELTYVGGQNGGITQSGTPSRELNGQDVSADGLTEMTCESNELQFCKVESLLYISFFTGGNGADSPPSNNPVAVEGKVAITSSAFGRKDPLEIGFRLPIEVEAAAVQISAAGSCFLSPTFFYTMILSVSVLLYPFV